MYKRRSTLDRLVQDGKTTIMKDVYLKREYKLLKDAVALGIAFKIASQHVSKDRTYFVLELVK